MRDALPVWRSLLFVPVTSEKFVRTAAERGADAIILDLEDAVAPSAIASPDAWPAARHRSSDYSSEHLSGERAKSH